MKQHLNITNLKILTLLVGLLSILVLIQDGFQILKIYSFESYESKIRISRDVENLMYCWCPYFFFKVFENKLENLFEKIGLTLNEDDK